MSEVRYGARDTRFGWLADSQFTVHDSRITIDESRIT